MSARKHRMPPVDHAYCCLHGPCKGMREMLNERVIKYYKKSITPLIAEGYFIAADSMATSGYKIIYCPWCGEKLT